MSCDNRHLATYGASDSSSNWRCRVDSNTCTIHPSINHLDIHHQLELLSLVTRLPVTSVITLHDLNLAAMFCDTVIVLKEGRVVAGGTPAEVLTSDLIAQVYNVRAEVLVDEVKGRLSILFEPVPVPVPSR